MVRLVKDHDQLEAGPEVYKEIAQDGEHRSFIILLEDITDIGWRMPPNQARELGVPEWTNKRCYYVPEHKLHFVEHEPLSKIYELR